MKQSAIERKWNLIRVVDGVATLQMGQLLKPLGWRKPARAIVGDIFNESVADAAILEIFDIIRRCSYDGGSNCGKLGGGYGEHTFQILTKRVERMRWFMRRLRYEDKCEKLAVHLSDDDAAPYIPKNVWLGVTVHDQASADEFVPLLLETPAAKRFVSYEPALGPVDWAYIKHDAIEGARIDCLSGFEYSPPLRDKMFSDEPFCVSMSPRNWTGKHGAARVHQIIFGGDIGPNARPPHPDWARNTQRQCAAAGTAFYFKQWGEWVGAAFAFKDCWKGPVVVDFDGKYRAAEDALPSPNSATMIRIGKWRAGRLLDGVEYSEIPV